MKNRFHNPSITSNPKELISAIQLSRTKSVGPITFLKLINKYELPSEALRATAEVLKRKGETIRALNEVEEEISRTEKFGAKMITIFDESYPALLAEISDPPIVLTIKGDHTKINTNAIAMVGARYSSANSISFAFKLAKDAAEKNVLIVSGLARGIDTAAHKGALKVNDKFSTIAVIGGGIDNIYPPENAELFEEIAERGAIITENEYGTVPKAEHFPRRNRIISGLSQVICVVEAALKSGSLITARFALEHGREIACVPGFPLDPRSEGTNMLIRKGANLITSANDVLEMMKDYSTTDFMKSNLSFNENDSLAEFIAENDDIEKVNLLDVISTSPTSIDELIDIYGFDASDINAKLLEHEITGEIIRHPGGKVSKAA